MNRLGKGLLVNFTMNGYERYVPECRAWAQANGFAFRDYHVEDLKRMRVYGKLKKMMDEPSGSGFSCWKPYIMLDALCELDADYVVYVDADDMISGEFRKLVEWALDENGVYLVETGYRNGDWTKRDCFVLMGCDSPEYWDARQLEAGSVGVVNDELGVDLMTEWARWCADERVVGDGANTCGMENLPGFQAHRRDQSILTNLKVRHGFKTVPEAELNKVQKRNVRPEAR